MQTLVVLHGVNGSCEEMRPLLKPLVPHYDVRAPNLLGHGGRPVPDTLTMEALEADLVAWLDSEGIGRAFFLGYSLGGYLALRLARHHPERALGVATIAAKYVFDAEMIARVAYLADPERLSRPGNPRKAELEQAHGADQWVQVAENVRTLVASFGPHPPLGEEDLQRIATPTLILSGERDPIVPLAETRRLAELLPAARLGVFPGQAHPFRVVPILPVVRAVRGFTADVGAGAFVPGPPLDLASSLVTGGMPQPELRVALGRDRPKP